MKVLDDAGHVNPLDSSEMSLIPCNRSGYISDMYDFFAGNDHADANLLLVFLVLTLWPLPPPLPAVPLLHLSVWEEELTNPWMTLSLP